MSDAFSIYFSNLITQTNDDTSAYYQWITTNARRISITPIANISALKSITLPDIKLKGCYENATKMMRSHPNIQYVEGYILIFGGIPIQHAWNRIGDAYFDITSEKLFPKRFGTEPYYVVVEPTNKEYIDIMLKTGEYGDLLRWWYHYHVRTSKIIDDDDIL